MNSGTGSERVLQRPCFGQEAEGESVKVDLVKHSCWVSFPFEWSHAAQVSRYARSVLIQEHFASELL